MSEAVLDVATDEAGSGLPVFRARPSWWLYFPHFLFFWLVVPPIVAVWQRFSLLLTVYPDRVVLERGLLNKDIKNVFIADIRTVDTYQSLTARIVGIGNIMIGTAATSGYEIEAEGIPEPERAREIILAYRGERYGAD